jgi:hypothetical protein
MNSRKFADTSSPAAPRSRWHSTADSPLCALSRPPLGTFVARIYCNPLRLAALRLPENSRLVVFFLILHFQELFLVSGRLDGPLDRGWGAN